MAISKITVNGVTNLDVTQTTATAATILDGYGCIGADGQWIDGTAQPASAPSLQDKTVTPTESQQVVHCDSDYDGLDDVTVNAISSSYVGSGITRRSSTDLSVSGATVTAPTGYYSSSASKSVASGTEGTPTATKGTVSNHSVSVTPSVTNTAGYISGGTKTGTAVSVSASELVSGTYTVSASGTADISNYASLSVPAQSLPTSTSNTSNSGTRKATVAASESTRYINIPTGYNSSAAYYQLSGVSSTYVGSGITSRSSTDLTASGDTVTVPAGYYASQATKAVSAGTTGTPTATKGTVSNHSVTVTPSVTNATGFITGGTKTGTAVTVTASELASGNLALSANTDSTSCVGYSTVSVAVPFVTVYTSTSNPTSSQGSNGDIWLVTA